MSNRAFAAEKFNPVYWEEINKMPKFVGSQSFLRNTLRNGPEISQLCGEAALSILTNQPGEILPTGTPLVADEKSDLTSPGSVLLVDIESVGPRTRQQSAAKEIHRASAYSRYGAWSELEFQPRHLFVTNAKQVGQKLKIYPYRKFFTEPLPAMFNARYTRVIGLLAFGYGQDGKTSNVLESIYEGPNVMGTTGHRIFRYTSLFRLNPMEIGSTYRLESLPWTGFPAHALPKQGSVRVRSAELLSQGTLQRAPAKTKANKIIPKPSVV